MYPRIFFRVFGRVKAHGLCCVEFEEREVENWVLVRTWERATFRCVCLAELNRLSSNKTLEAVVLRWIIDAACPDVLVVSVHGGPHVLVELFSSDLRSGTAQNCSSTRCLIFACSNGAFSGLLHLCSGSCPHFQWRSLSSTSHGCRDSTLNGISPCTQRNHFYKWIFNAASSGRCGQY